MFCSTFSLSECGSGRKRNEDALLADAAHGWFAVADGMGGLEGGKEASSWALRLLQAHLKRRPQVAMAELLTAVNTEHRDLGLDSFSNGFGSTLTFVRVSRDATGRSALELGHVGDSAAYLVRGGEVRLLTTEHTVAARLAAEKADLDDSEIPLRAFHQLTQCIGQTARIEPQIERIPLDRGDRVLLFTDGVVKALRIPDLEALLLQPQPLSRLCQQITFKVEAAGSPDNYTLVAFEL